MIFLISGQLKRHPLTKFFHLSNLLQMPNDHRIVDTEFLGNLSCSGKRIGLNDGSQLATVNFWWPTTTLLIVKAFPFFAKVLEQPPCCTFVSNSWAKCIADVTSCLWFFMIHFQGKKKMLEFAFCLTSFLTV